MTADASKEFLDAVEIGPPFKLSAASNRVGGILHQLQRRKPFVVDRPDVSAAGEEKFYGGLGTEGSRDVQRSLTLAVLSVDIGLCRNQGSEDPGKLLVVDVRECCGQV